MGLCGLSHLKELEVERGMNVFVEQFTPKMTFEYEGEKITVTAIEMELAQKYPNVPSKIVDAYVKKVEQRILSNIEENTKVQQAKGTGNPTRRNRKPFEQFKMWHSGKMAGKGQGVASTERGVRTKYQQILKRGKKACLVPPATPYLFQDSWKERCSFTKVFEKEEGFLLRLVMPEEAYFLFQRRLLCNEYTSHSKLWRAVTGQSPSHFKGEDLPVER